MLYYSFMKNAFIAGTFIAIICGMVSFFVVLRKVSFAAHSLGHISLTGASGAILIGISAMTGQLMINVIAANIIGALGDKIKKSDLTIGMVLTFFLGLGAYFLYLYQTGYSGSVMSILFGNILTVSFHQITILLIMSIVIFITLILISRKLFFASVDPLLARAKNVPNKILSMIFFTILAVTVTMACQIVGTLLVFTLLIGPAACAFQWSDGFYRSMILSITIAILSVWSSLSLAFYANLPVSFCITMVICGVYVIGLVKNFMIKKL